MESLKNFGKSFFNIFRSKKEESNKENNLTVNRKRQLDEEVLTKDSISNPPKRVKTMDEVPLSNSQNQTTNTPHVQQSPVGRIYSSVKSWFMHKASPECVDYTKRSTAVVSPETVQAAPPTLYSSAKLDTDEVKLLKVTNPSKESSLDSFAFSNESLVQGDATLIDRNAGVGHIIRTSYEKERKSELLSSPNLRKKMKAGYRSTFDKYFTEKNITKRSLLSNKEIAKGFKKQNAFNYSSSLVEKEKYLNLLKIRCGFIPSEASLRFSPLANKASFSPTNDLKSPKAKNGIESLLGSSHNVSSDIVGGPKITSTVIKEKISKDKTIEDAEVSPVFNRSKNPEKLTGLIADSPIVIDGNEEIDSKADSEIINISSQPFNSLERELGLKDVCSPKYLENLMNRFGSVAREREKVIAQEEEKKKKCEKETEKICASIDLRLEQYLKITEVAVPEVEEEEKFGDDLTQPTKLPEFTEEMKSVVRSIRSRRGVIIDAHKIQITAKDLETLQGLNWLNDEVINFYMQMIVSRSEGDKYCDAYAFSTFFYPKLKDGGHTSVKRWTKKIDIFSYAIVLVPVHLGMHWCLATIDNQRRHITYYDSMGGQNIGCLRSLEDYIKEEHRIKKGQELDFSAWKSSIANKIPQQMNGSDCGMFTCKFAEYLSRRAQFTFSQSDMPYFRKRMIYEIVNDNLIYP